MTDIIEEIELLEAKYGITGTKEGFKEELKKLFQKKLANQKKEMIERIREKKQSHFTEWQTLGYYKDGYLDAVDNILDDIIQAIKRPMKPIKEKIEEIAEYVGIMDEEGTDFSVLGWELFTERIVALFSKVIEEIIIGKDQEEVWNGKKRWNAIYRNDLRRQQRAKLKDILKEKNGK